MIINNTYTFNYQGKRIKYHIFAHKDAIVIHKILFLGTLQTPRIARRVAANCPIDTIVVQGAPHWRADKSGKTIPDFMYQYTKIALCIILGKYHVSKSYILIAESQAVPAILRLGNDVCVKSIIAIQPLGLNTQSYPGTNLSKYKELNRRTRLNLIHQKHALLKDANLVTNHITMIAISLRETLLGRAKNHYGVGLSYSSIEDLKIVANKTKLILPDLDELFPPKEILLNIKASGIKCANIEIVPNIPHSPLSSKAGQILLEHALNA